MENEVIKTVTVSLVKKDEELLKEIVARGVDESLAQKALRYNLWTVNQFRDLSGLSISSVTNLTRPSITGGVLVAKLDVTYPFPDKDGPGPKFIIRNEKSMKYLRA